MKIAVIRVRGPVRVRHDIAMALRLMGLTKSNSCVVVDDSPARKRTLEKVKDYVTWGPVSEEVVGALGKKGKKVVGLNPPRKGFGRKGIKIPFKIGGALGDRGDKINDLIKRML